MTGLGKAYQFGYFPISSTLRCVCPALFAFVPGCLAREGCRGWTGTLFEPSLRSLLWITLDAKVEDGFEDCDHERMKFIRTF